jgi:hypothetical protein
MDIRPVSWLNIRQFLNFPHQVYSRYPNKWVPPLKAYTLISMGKFRTRDKAFYLAYRDGQPVARAGFKIHTVHGQPEAVHFGYFEALPGTEAEVAALIEAGHRLAPHLPMRGPHQFRLEDPYTALLIDGFDQEPYLFMSYNPPYYLQLLEQAGFVKVQDLLTYLHPTGHPDFNHKSMEARAARAYEKGIKVRKMGPNLRAEVNRIAEVMNSALAGNWGFEPIQGEQLEELMLLGRLIIRRESVFFAYHEDEPDKVLGCCIMLPNLNPMLKASGGALNWTLLRMYLNRNSWVDSYRGYALGVKPEGKSYNVAPAMLDTLLQGTIRPEGWREVEVSWILETNRLMKTTAVALGGTINRVYRVLEKPPL